jgi:hypothetical protein
MPEGHAIAAFTQARAIVVPAGVNLTENGVSGERAALDQAEGRALMSVKSAE